ncbi:hypothetical protein DSM3645_03493 [Blastopirellula marina DSM 3645]|uniref:Uncharacterized protein n=1 Tax=Blastopirellula marina DSM 3645 TaxID=314230 RepID=A3ZW12_9BACT|nr:hypothetical protein DSM3645_03493 [Blastopirellula marina DSM 3645]
MQWVTLPRRSCKFRPKGLNR